MKYRTRLKLMTTVCEPFSIRVKKGCYLFYRFQSYVTKGQRWLKYGVPFRTPVRWREMTRARNKLSGHHRI